MDIYFDTNAVSYFDERLDWNPSRLSAARDALRRRVVDGDISVFVSYPLFEEVLGLLESNTEKYFRVMGFLLDVSKFNLLHSTDELGKAEVTTGGLRGGNERLELWVRTVAVRRALRKGRGLEDIPRLTQEGFAEFESEEERRRDEMRIRLAAETGERALDSTRRWWRSAELQIDDWVGDHMRDNRERLGISDDRATWPPPSALQTIWRYYAYRMARIYLNVGEGRRVRGSDSYDAHHYAAASSMDIMVSDDRDLRATCQEIPQQPFELLTFEEFIAGQIGV